MNGLAGCSTTTTGKRPDFGSFEFLHTTGIQGECNVAGRTWPRGRRERPLVDGDGIGFLDRHRENGTTSGTLTTDSFYCRNRVKTGKYNRNLPTHPVLAGLTGYGHASQQFGSCTPQFVKRYEESSNHPSQLQEVRGMRNEVDGPLTFTHSPMGSLSVGAGAKFRERASPGSS